TDWNQKILPILQRLGASENLKLEQILDTLAAESQLRPEVWWEALLQRSASQDLPLLLQSVASLSRKQDILRRMGELRDPSHVELLLELCKSSEEALRTSANQALREIDGSRVVDHSLPMLSDPDIWIRHSGISGLMLSQDPRKIAPLLEIL